MIECFQVLPFKKRSPLLHPVEYFLLGEFREPALHRALYSLPSSVYGFRLGQDIVGGAVAPLLKDHSEGEVLFFALSEANRGRGLGKQAYFALEEKVFSNCKKVVCSTKAPEFFSKLGFIVNGSPISSRSGLQYFPMVKPLSLINGMNILTQNLKRRDSIHSYGI